MLPGPANASAVEPTIHHQTGTNAVIDGDGDDVIQATSGTEPLLGDVTGTRVILQVHRDSYLMRQAIGNGRVSPAKVRGED